MLAPWGGGEKSGKEEVPRGEFGSCEEAIIEDLAELRDVANGVNDTGGKFATGFVDGAAWLREVAA